MSYVHLKSCWFSFLSSQFRVLGILSLLLASSPCSWCDDSLKRYEWMRPFLLRFFFNFIWPSAISSWLLFSLPIHLFQAQFSFPGESGNVTLKFFLTKKNEKHWQNLEFFTQFLQPLIQDPGLRNQNLCSFKFKINEKMSKMKWILGGLNEFQFKITGVNKLLHVKEKRKDLFPLSRKITWIRVLQLDFTWGRAWS